MLRGQGVHARQVWSEDNAADFLTKPLGAAAFAKHRLEIMGPQDHPDADALD